MRRTGATRIQLERCHHRLLALVLMGVVGGLIAAGWLGLVLPWVALAQVDPQGRVLVTPVLLIASLFTLLTTPIFVGGLRDVLFGYVLVLDRGELTWPRLMATRGRVRLADLADVRGGQPEARALELLLRDGELITLGGTGALRMDDLEAAAERIRAAIADHAEATRRRR